MKKTFGLAAAAILAISSVAVAGNDKVDVCKVTPSNDAIPFFAGVLYFGHENSVSSNSANQPYDGPAFFGEEAAGPIAAFQEAGAQLPNADCYIWVPNE